MKERVQNLKKGVRKEDAFAYLNRKEEDFILLNREEMVSTLYGGQRLEFIQTVSLASDYRNFLQSLTGYRLIFKDVQRDHGISSPIAMKTHEKGYSYSAVFIFKDGVLYEKPVLSGGVVDTSSSKTLFDYLTPDALIGQIGV